MKNVYTIDEIFNKKEEIKEKQAYNLHMDFDFPSWLTDSNLPLQNFSKKTTYKLEYDLQKIDYLRNEMKSIYAKDKERAFNRYLMHHGMEKGSGLLERRFQKIIIV